jgi:hypothetical protein
MNQTARRHDRTDLQMQATLVHDQASLPCSIVNISAGGARLRLEAGTLPPEGVEVTLEFARFGSFPATTIWRTGIQLGIRFTKDPDAMAEVVMGLALYASGQGH